MATETYPMTSADPTPAVNRAYQQGQVFGWVRETYVNAFQADATQVLYTTEWIAATELGVHRRVVFDDGRGMSSDELPQFFNSWGGSAQSVGGVNENYGYGSKVSLLPWNTYGVVALSRRDGATSMMWLHRGSDGRYGVRALEDVSEDVIRDVKVVVLSDYDSYPDPDDSRLDWVEVMGSVFGSIDHGTALVLLGNDAGDDTAYYGDRNRREDTKFGIAQYLNGRFFRLPIPARIDPLYPTDRDNWPTRYGSNESRQARALGETIDRGTNEGIQSGVVDVPSSEGAGLGARIHWWMTGTEVPTSGDRNVLPLFGYRYSSHPEVDEIYSLEVGHGAPHLGQMVASTPVRKRLGILIEPVGTEEQLVYPAGNSRAGLQYDIDGQGGGHDLPFLLWRAAWLRRIPEEVREAILAAMPKDDSNPAVEASIHRYLSEEFLPFLQARRDVVVPQVDGDLRSGLADTKRKNVGVREKPKEGEDPKPRRGPRPKRSAPTGPPPAQGQGVEPSAIARRQAGLVDVQVVTEPDRDSAVWYDATAGVQSAYINRASATYTRAVDYLASKYRALGRIGDEGDARWIRFISLVEQVMRTHVTTAITELLFTANEDKSKADAYLSPEACSATLMGLNWISQAMSKVVNANNLPIMGEGVDPEDEEVGE